MLNKVGTHEDIQNIVTGGITKNVGIKVLDGTEIISYNTSYNRFALTGLGENGESNVGYCTHYKQLSTSVASNDMCFSWSSSGTLHWKDSRFSNDIVGMKAYLASEYAKGTPVIVVYPLATPTTSTVTAQPITVNKGTYNVVAEGSLSGLDIQAKYLGNN